MDTAHARIVSLLRSRAPAWGQSLLRALWFVVIPALLAGLVLRWLVLGVSAGVEPPFGTVIDAGHRYPVRVGACLFLFFAALARYWRAHLPGALYLAGIPVELVDNVARDPARQNDYVAGAALHRSLSAPRIRRRLARTLPTSELAEVDAHRDRLWAALETGDLRDAREATRGINALARPALAAEQRRESWTNFAALGVAAAAAMVVQAKVGSAYHVVGSSMLPTLEPNDLVAASRLAYRSLTRGIGPVPSTTPRRGDVVVFSPRAGLAASEVLVKRVIGVPGDRVEMRGGVPVINGWEVPTCDVGEYLRLPSAGESAPVQGRLLLEFLDDRAYLTLQAGRARSFDEPYTVRRDEVFVLGDNRANSLDSRAMNEGRGGGVPLGDIEARVEWFLVGAHLDGRADFDRTLRSLDVLGSRPHLETMDDRSLRDGVARCLGHRPENTAPPQRPDTPAPPGT